MEALGKSSIIWNSTILNQHKPTFLWKVHESPRVDPYCSSSLALYLPLVAVPFQDVADAVHDHPGQARRIHYIIYLKYDAFNILMMCIIYLDNLKQRHRRHSEITT